MGQELMDWAATHGYRVTWRGVAELHNARREVERRGEGGELDRSFYDRLQFSGQPGPFLEKARSVIIVAVPRPANALTFELDDGILEAVLPPTYCHYGDLRRRLLPSVTAATGGEAWLLDEGQIPLKTLAVRAGLAEYGRNNVTYVPGMGSYHQLAAFLCDTDLGAPPCRPVDGLRSMPECERCAMCIRACPTGAIGEDRFLLHAERCLTLFNEEPDPWPDWLPAAAHNCLVGCMLCQEVCPKNRGLLSVEPCGVTFTAEETRSILSGTGDSGEAWDQIDRKLDEAGIKRYHSVAARNLGALLRSRVRLSHAGDRQ